MKNKVLVPFSGGAVSPDQSGIDYVWEKWLRNKPVMGYMFRRVSSDSQPLCFVECQELKIRLVSRISQDKEPIQPKQIIRDVLNELESGYSVVVMDDAFIRQAPVWVFYQLLSMIQTAEKEQAGKKRKGLE